MNKPLLTFLLVWISFCANAADLPYTLQQVNPGQVLGYFVGDVLQRTVKLEVEQPYKLVAGSLPVKGVIRKGIELREIDVKEHATSDITHYQLTLAYQVFAGTESASKIALPDEMLRLSGGGKHLDVVVPQWAFRLSPLAARDVVDIEADMSPYRGPMLVALGYWKPALGAALAMVVCALAGLIYINADAAWFPGMGGPFAASYRQISVLAPAPESARQAVTSLHRAFNQTLGENLFQYNLTEFLEQYPAFAGMRAEIIFFFGISNQLLYQPYPADAATNHLAFLRAFCERCRDCERGVA